MAMTGPATRTKMFVFTASPHRTSRLTLSQCAARSRLSPSQIAARSRLTRRNAPIDGGRLTILSLTSIVA
jgi:hypothetical protein